MKLSQLIREKAKKNPKIIVLPEGEEPRMIKAAEIIINEGEIEAVESVGIRVIRLIR